MQPSQAQGSVVLPLETSTNSPTCEGRQHGGWTQAAHAEVACYMHCMSTAAACRPLLPHGIQLLSLRTQISGSASRVAWWHSATQRAMQCKARYSRSVTTSTCLQHTWRFWKHPYKVASVHGYEDCLMMRHEPPGPMLAAEHACCPAPTHSGHCPAPWQPPVPCLTRSSSTSSPKPMGTS